MHELSNTIRQLDWAKTLESDRLDKDDQKVVLSFLIYFNIFEAKLFKNDRNNVPSKLKALCNSLSETTWFNVACYDSYGAFFSDRYILEDGTIRGIYKRLGLSNSYQEKIAKMLKNFKSKGSHSQEQFLYYLLIAFRFRNNLFHGSKNPLGLEVYIDCFQQINYLIHQLITDMCNYQFEGLKSKF